MKRFLCSLLVLVFSLYQAVAVQVSGGYQTTAPTNADIANWTTGWGAPGITGWDYVGTVNGDSAVYLGNGWVLTAAHVGSGDFTLQGTAYTAINGSAVGITNVTGTADITLFQIASAPALPALTIADVAPIPFSSSNAGTAVAMLGFGGGQGETWGQNTITAVDRLIEVTGPGYDFKTVDYQTAYGTTTAGLSAVTNNAQLVGGDSGGGNFTYNASTGNWVLTGLNEAVGGGNAYMVELSNYAPQIKNIVTPVPEPKTWALIGMGFALLIVRRMRISRSVYLS